MTKPKKLFSKFPATLYITNDGSGFLAWETKKDAAEAGISSDSEVAIYDIVRHGKAIVEYTVEIG